MPVPLPRLEFLKDYVLGPVHIDDETCRYYISTDRREQVKGIVVGVVRSVIRLHESECKLVLVAPPPTSPALRDLFQGVEDILQSILEFERSDCENTILSTTEWSRRAADNVESVIFVDLGPDTISANLDWARKELAGLEKTEIPTAPAECSVFEKGALRERRLDPSNLAAVSDARLPLIWKGQEGSKNSYIKIADMLHDTRESLPLHMDEPRVIRTLRDDGVAQTFIAKEGWSAHVLRPQIDIRAKFEYEDACLAGTDWTDVEAIGFYSTMATPPTMQQTRAALLQTAEYLAAPAVVSSHGWKRKEGGHIIVGGTGQLLAVGRVIDSKYDVADAGNWRHFYSDPIDKAKWVVMLECPDGTVFEPDWPAVLRHVEKIQGGICDGTKAKNFVFTDRTGSLLRFTQGVFTKKKTGDAAGFDVTGWPIQSEMRDRFNAVVETHHMRPLLVFDNQDRVVDPATLKDRLLNSIVEMMYEFKHWEMKDKAGAFFNTFTGNITQIRILEEAGADLPAPTPQTGPRRLYAAALPQDPVYAAALPTAPPQQAPAQVVVPPTTTGGDAAPATTRPASIYDSPTPGQVAYAAAIAADVPSTPPRQTPGKGAALSPTPYSPGTPAGFYQGLGSALGGKTQGPRGQPNDAGEGASGSSLAPALPVDESGKRKAVDDGNPGAAKKSALGKT
ncbi:hypothetical protein B0H11DRAFT_2263415 [Mycena galericulata]|nr:hypothetical protein B0H11DRAFT_2263415 [Mycena galericulata]